MDWTASSVAGLCLAERRASDATMLCRSGYRPRARLHATAAALAARIECAPVGSHTIDGTRRSAAALRLAEVLASVTTVCSRCFDITASGYGLYQWNILIAWLSVSILRY